MEKSACQNKNDNHLFVTFRPVSKGEPICISFFETSEYTFLERQARLQNNFYISCACRLCIDQSADHFALRCNACNGPVPFDPNLLPKGKCLRCEAKMEDSNTAAVLADLQVISMTVGMLSGVGGASNVVTSGQLGYLDAKLSKLTNQVDLQNRQFLKSVAGLAEEYIHLKQYGSAVAWYQWFVDSVHVHLYQLKCSNTEEDPFENLSAVSKWATAYLGFIESVLSSVDSASQHKLGKKRKQSTNGAVRPRHFTTAKYLFKKMLTLVDDLQFGHERNDEDSVIGREQYELLMESMKQSAKVCPPVLVCLFNV